MKKKSIYQVSLLYLLGGISLLFYITYLIFYIAFHNNIVLDEALFMTEYAKFLGTLTLAVLGFLAIHVYWELKKKEIDIKRLSNNVDIYINLIYEMIKKMHDAINGKPKELTSPELYTFTASCLKKVRNLDSKIDTHIFELDKKESTTIYTNHISPILHLLIDEWEKNIDVGTYYQTYRKNIELVIFKFNDLYMNNI